MKEGSRKRERRCVPVTAPPNGVRAPLAALTAVRENEPVTGNEPKNEPNRLLLPMAIISWLASMR